MPDTNTFLFNTTGLSGENSMFTLADLTGRQLRADRPQPIADGADVDLMDITGVQPGAYFVTVSNAAKETGSGVTISLSHD